MRETGYIFRVLEKKISCDGIAVNQSMHRVGENA